MATMHPVATLGAWQPSTVNRQPQKFPVASPPARATPIRVGDGPGRTRDADPHAHARDPV